MNCKFVKYLPDLLFGELSDEQRANVEQHLETCKSCRETLAGFESVHGVLSQSARPEPDRELLKSYRADLLKLFGPEQRQYEWVQQLGDWWERIFRPRPLFYRLAGAAVLILVGVFVGRIYYSNPESEMTPPQPTTAVAANVIDRDFLNNYLTESEILLLGIENNRLDELHPEDVQINRQIARKLLIQTSHIQQVSNGFKDEEILDYLTRLELLLLELSNAEEDDIIDAFSEVRRIVVESDLLQSVKTIQQKVNVEPMEQI